MSAELLNVIQDFKAGQLTLENLAGKLKTMDPDAAKEYSASPSEREDAVERLKAATLVLYREKPEALEPLGIKSELDIVKMFRNANVLTKSEAMAGIFKNFNASSIVAMISGVGNVILMIIIVANAMGV